MKNIIKNYHLLYSILIILCICFLSIGFSAFQNKLYIDDIGLTVKVDKDIRIMGVQIDSVNNAISTYEDYNVSNINSNIKLESEDSYIIYNVDIYNLGNVEMGLKEININNENLKVEIINYNLKTKLCEENDKCSSGAKIKLKVKVSYQNGKYDNTATMNNIKIDFSFGRIYNINYNDIDSTNLPKEIIEGETLNVNITNQIDYFLKVFMNNKKLSSESDYQYENDNLIVPNVNGDINIYFKMPICQRATTLHTEECIGNYCAGMGYKVDGSMGTKTITFGSLGTTGTLSSGDAFDCDVNGDGIYDSTTERFYYVTDMEKDIAVLIYYNNVSEGKPDNSKFYPYDASKENWHGPRSAIEQLPTKSQWSNVKLYNTERIIKNEYDTTSNKDGNTYPEVFSYSKYAARILTLKELKGIVDFYIPSWKTGEFDKHLYLVENTNFSKKNNSNFDGYWLETPRNTMSTYAWMVYATTRRVHSVEVNRNDILGVRPVIEVQKSDISY